MLDFASKHMYELAAELRKEKKVGYLVPCDVLVDGACKDETFITVRMCYCQIY